jgi:hypothetical protein
LAINAINKKANAKIGANLRTVRRNFPTNFEFTTQPFEPRKFFAYENDHNS